MRTSILALVLTVVLACAARCAEPDDSIHISSPADASALRSSAIAEIFPGGFPQQQPNAVTAGVSSPLENVPDLASVDRLTVTVGTSTTYPFVYRPTTANGKLIVVHQGHSGNHESYGTGGLVRELVGQGCTVVVCVMPGGPNETTSGSTGNHGSLTLEHHLTAPAVALNHELANWTPSFVGMTGLSGGGWATVVFSGLDQRINKSVSVAGWLPLYMPTGGPGNRDREQSDIGSLSASYLDFAILAGQNWHRQLLHTIDDCCFTQAAYQSQAPYATEVSAAAAAIGGTYQLTWVEQRPHVISKADRDIILADFGLTVPAVVIVDNEDATFSLVGTWTKWNDGYAGTIDYTAPGSGERKATWLVPGVSGQVEVFATWVQHANRGTDVPYTVKDGENVVATVEVNQQVAPSGIIEGGRAFQSLGSFPVSDALSIEMTDDANGYVIADAIRVEVEGEIEPPPEPPEPGDWVNFSGSYSEWLGIPDSDKRVLNGVLQVID